MPPDNNSASSPRVDPSYRSNFFSLMLSLLGVTQGLAINLLAGKIPDVTDSYWKIGGMLKVVNFLICFVVVVRVFETYFSASLMKAQSRFSPVDLFSIFAVGLLQYSLIESLGNDDQGLYLRILMLAIAAVFLHGLTTFRFLVNGFIELPPGVREYAIKSEFWNIGISLIILIIAFFAYHTSREDIHLYQGVVMIMLLTLNIFVSMSGTTLNTEGTKAGSPQA